MKFKHGHLVRNKRSPEHSTWTNVKQRCLNKNSKDYPRYGGRGIKLCDRWKVFKNFLDDMGLKPSKKHSIHRIDNDGHYEPKNCVWATAKVQALNKKLVKRNSASGLRGIQIRENGKFRVVVQRKTIGTFSSRLEAIRAYNKKALEIFKDRAILNKEPV